jgi:hypothetical protein
MKQKESREKGNGRRPLDLAAFKYQVLNKQPSKIMKYFEENDQIKAKKGWAKGREGERKGERFG